MIDSAQKFLNTDDIFEIFKYDSEEIDKIKHQSCFKLKNGDYIVRAGIQNNMNYLRELLKRKLEEQCSATISYQEEAIKDVINKNPLLRSLIAWYLQNEHLLNKSNVSVNNHNNNNFHYNISQNTININHSNVNNVNSDQSINNSLFTSSFIDTITNNIIKSEQGQRYNDFIKKFSILLYTLGRKLAYQFVRMNIAGALQSLTTLSTLMSNTDSMIVEGRFRFIALKQYTDSVNTKYGFCSEDCTDVIKKVKYDVTTNSFVGFVTKFSNGIPISEYYKTDSYEQLKTWFANVQKPNLLNIFMFQSLPSPSSSTPASSFLMNAFGVDGTALAMDIIYRWVHIFECCLKTQIRIIGFSTGRFILVFCSYHHIHEENLLFYRWGQ
ncbi:unnamed protein product [Rotaria sp. Silwood2]|nr:unnamed protein product [Rotaria sp. Silwood2]CAF4241777.1 unnamed protein product [Rotaria sp. Silwood2]CAF4381849.1 unnamed protein product [Rotaria sp. Silwood2]